MAEVVQIEKLTDEELIAHARALPEHEGRPYLDALYQRFYPRVGYWCLKICGNRQEAGDLAQEVFLRVHSRLDTFRVESRFSTWLYQVTRSVAINRGVSESRRRMSSLDADDRPEPADPTPDTVQRLEQGELVERFRQAIRRDLDPLEAKILYLHFSDGLTVGGITELLGLTNKSGAKAYLVSARRKLHRRFGRWLEGHLANGVVD